MVVPPPLATPKQLEVIRCLVAYMKLNITSLHPYLVAARCPTDKRISELTAYEAYRLIDKLLK